MEPDRANAVGRNTPGDPASPPDAAGPVAPPTGELPCYSRKLETRFLDAVTRSDRILEAGCGTGEFCNDLAAAGHYRVTGVDPDPAAVERARQAAVRLEAFPVPRFAVGRAEHLPLEASQFTMVLARIGFAAAPSGESLRQALAELHRVLAPRGRLFAAALAAATDAPGTYAPEAGPPAGPPVGGRYTPYQFERLLLEVGFKVLLREDDHVLVAGRREQCLTVVAAKAKVQPGAATKAR